MKCVFEYLRRGDLQTAQQLLRSCRQSWRSAALLGAVYFHDRTNNVGLVMDENGNQDSEMDADESAQMMGGNPNRGLWMWTCRQIAKEVHFL